jgi:beta-lactamase regulating signal transducer with metallopeptidase domain
MIESITTVVPTLSLVLLHFVWQGALIGVAAWAALALARNARPQTRYALACAGLALCLALPLWSLLLAEPSAAIGVTDAVARTLGSASLPSANLATSPNDQFAAALHASATAYWVVSAWAVGAALLSLRALLGLVWVRRLRTRSTPYLDPVLLATLARLAKQMGLRRALELRTIDTENGPMSAGLLRPFILFPAVLATRLPTEMIEALLAHELAHVRRHDYLVNLLQSLVETLLFYHPVVWWLSNRIRDEREQIADDLATTATGDRPGLACALAALDRLTCNRDHLIQAARGGQLMHRIQRLVHERRPASGGRVAVPVIGVVTAALAFYAQAQVLEHRAVRGSDIVSGLAVAGVQPPDPPAPISPPAASDPPAAPAPPAARPPIAAPVGIHGIDESGRESYALVDGGSRDGFAMSGSLDDIEAIRVAQRLLTRKFIWFMHEGKPYVIEDSAIVAQVERGFAAGRQHEAELEALSDQMQQQGNRVETMAARLETLTRDTDEAAVSDIATAIESLAEEKSMLALEQGRLADRARDPEAKRLSQLEQDLERLDAQQKALDGEIERLTAELSAKSRKRDAEREPIEVLERQIASATESMEPLGAKIEALAGEHEAAFLSEDRSIRELLREAHERGLSRPAPPG